MPGNMTFDQLKDAVDNGTIDTVVVAAIEDAVAAFRASKPTQ